MHEDAGEADMLGSGRFSLVWFLLGLSMKTVGHISIDFSRPQKTETGIPILDFLDVQLNQLLH